MCGIIGLAGDMNLRDENTIKRLFVLDTLRGQDSTGLAAIRRNGDAAIAKLASHPFNLFEMQRFKDTLNYHLSRAFIGHNRSATSGDPKSDTNAHPYTFGHITGVHNGTLADGDKAMLEKKLDERFNVDSQALYAAIAEFGIKEVIPLLTKGKDYSRGAWSLVWWDAKTKKLNFLRNEHRPMWYCWTEDFKQLWYASEFWMLDAALNHTQVGSYKLFKHESKDTPGKFFRFFQTPIDMHLTVDIDEISKGSNERPKFHAAALKGKEPETAGERAYPFVDRSGKRHGNECGGNISSLTPLRQLTKKQKKNGKTGVSGTLTRSSDDKIPGVIHLIGDVDKPYANYILREDYAHVGHSRHNGDPKCNWCGKPVPYGLPGITLFFRDNVLVCPKCSGHELVSPLSDVAPPSRFIVTTSMMQDLK